MKIEFPLDMITIRLKPINPIVVHIIYTLNWSATFLDNETYASFKIKKKKKYDSNEIKFIL